MFTFMFSVVQSHDRLIQTSAFSSLAASLTAGRDRSSSMPVAELAREWSHWWRWDLLGNPVRVSAGLFSWLSYVVSVVQSGNGKWVHFQALPDLLSLLLSMMSRPSWMLPLGWAHEMQVREFFQKREANSWVTIQITVEVCSQKLTLGLYIL